MLHAKIYANSSHSIAMNRLTFAYKTRILPLLLLALGASACSAQEPRDNGTTGTRTSNAPAIDRANSEVTGSRRNAITRAVQKVSPAVVGINVTEVREMRYRSLLDQFFEQDPFFQRYGPRRRTFKQELHGLGSGFIISPDGYVVTNDHVAGRASKVIVTMTDGKQYDAKVIGSDPTTDVALLKIEGKNLPYIEFGNSDDVVVGEWAIALGNPFGLFDINSKPTVTVGVVSNTEVNLQPQDGRVYRGMIQTDAAISSGNSGGALVNALGELIGMNTIIYSTAQSGMGAGSIGIGFAVPTNRLKAIVAQLKKGDGIDRNFWTGMNIQQIDDRIARYLQLQEKEGVVVVEIIANSPAAQAGLEPGDVIKEIKGETIKSEDDAVALISDSQVGDTITMKILRDGKTTNKTMKLTTAPTR
ncbi:MAG: Trypsin-like serine protease [Chlorobi bacterium OLB7]|nr:MAG: Trypsin-like serine protease [Chlorobi bacterium OLB7]